MQKDKTLWQLILDIIAFFTTRNRKKHEAQIEQVQKQQEQFKKVENKLEQDYHNIENKKQTPSNNIQDISDQLNSRF